MAEDTLKPETKLREYTTKRVLGRGAFGITYLAEQITEHYAVAIKEYFLIDFAVRDRDGTTVNPKTTDQSTREYNIGLENFLEESRILSGFRSPHIVRVVDKFELNGTAYMVMQYEKGGTLEQYLEAYPRPLAESKILSFFVPVFQGLKDVHTQWLLHRDIKPGNIYIRADGTLLLIDFGIARHMVTSRQRGMTAHHTPGYAPPEQYERHESHGPWTDIYAVGATMYYCVTRIKPPDSKSRGEAVDPLVPAVQAAPSLYSRDLLALIDWMMAPDAGKRPQNVDEVLSQLENLQASATGPGAERIAETIKRESSDHRDVEEEGEPKERAPLEQEPAKIEPASPQTRQGWPFVWIGLALVMVVAVGAAIVWGVRTSRLHAGGQPDQNDVASEVDSLLSQCNADIEADRLATGAGGNALNCYRSVLELDTANTKALAGLKRLEDTYLQRTRSAIEAGESRPRADESRRTQEAEPRASWDRRVGKRYRCLGGRWTESGTTAGGRRSRATRGGAQSK